MEKRPRNRLRREAVWFGALFFVPFLGLVVFDISTSPSPMPVSQRICTPEDICAYGHCFILPALAYLIVRGGYALLRGVLRILSGGR